MATVLPQVFGQLETAVAALPEEYTGKAGYTAWIADARAKYTSPPPDVDTYITGLKAAGTALRAKGDVAAPAAEAAGASGAAAPAPAPAAAPAPAEPAAPAATAAAAGEGAAAAPAAADAAAAPAAQIPLPVNASIGVGLPNSSTPALANTLSPSSSQPEGALGLGQGTPPETLADRGIREAAEAAADEGITLEESGGKRKTHHQTPKRRRSAKKGRSSHSSRKKLSKKKTGSRK